MTGLFYLAYYPQSYVVACIIISSFFKAKKYSIVYTTFCLSIHPSLFITLKDDLTLASLAAAKGIVFPDIGGNRFEEFGK